MKKKKCAHCKKSLLLKSFSDNKTTKDGKHHMCRSCQSEFSKAHYYKNKEVYLKRNKRNKEVATEFIASFKKDKKCCLCPEDDSCCLDFHHLRDKKFHISKAGGWGLSIESIQQEIDKCVLLCSNCHRKLHHGRADIIERLVSEIESRRSSKPQEEERNLYEIQENRNEP